jgi:NADH:ubiquinone oxidoreductase subunit E
MDYQIKICMGSSCFARGNVKNLETIESFLAENNLTAGIELTGSRCENRCCEGPNIEINGILYNKIDSGSLVDLLKEFPGMNQQEKDRGNVNYGS